MAHQSPIRPVGRLRVRARLGCGAACVLVLAGCTNGASAPAADQIGATATPSSTAAVVPPPSPAPPPAQVADRSTLLVIDPWALTPTAPADPGTSTITQLAHVTADAGVLVSDAPGGAVIGVLPSRTLSDATVLPIVESDHDGAWLRVELPSRLNLPSDGAVNGATGWVSAGAVETSPVTHSIHIDLAARTASVLDATGAVTYSTPVAIGAAATPTPTGRGYLLSRWTEPGYTPRVAAVSMHSGVLDEFDGGPASIGIHTVAGLRSDGAVSNGCLRLPSDAAFDVVESLPIGTPITIG